MREGDCTTARNSRCAGAVDSTLQITRQAVELTLVEGPRQRP